MTPDEARLILDISEEASPEEINERFDHLFQANDPSSGGSPYIQAKVFRAKEALELMNHQPNSSSAQVPDQKVDPQ